MERLSFYTHPSSDHFPLGFHADTLKMRASMAASRQSQLPGSVANAAAVAKLLEKKKEFEAVAALERASAQFLKRIEELGDDFDVMADAGIGAHMLTSDS